MHPWCILEETPCLRSWVHHPNLYDPPQQPSASPCVLSPPTSPEPPGSHAAVASIERHDKQPPLVKQNNGAYEAMWPLSTSIWCMNLPQGWLKVDKLSVCILEICFFLARKTAEMMHQLHVLKPVSLDFLWPWNPLASFKITKIPWDY